MNWFHKVRLQVLAVLLAATLAVIGILAWATVPAWPVVGVALITVAAVVNTMTTRLAAPVCYQCGNEMKAAEPGCYGLICDGCGAVNEVVSGERRFARIGTPVRGQADGMSSAAPGEQSADDGAGSGSGTIA